MKLYFAFTAAILISAIVCYLLIPIAEKFDLTDKPCPRKQHSGHIPLVGGLSVYFATIISVFVFKEASSELLLFFLSSTLIVFVGVLDDRFDLSVRVRIFTQLVAAGIIVFQSEIFITSLGNIIGFDEISLANWGMPFTVIAIMAAINAYNMIDGIDGLLGSMAIVAFSGGAIYAAINSQNFSLLFALVMIGALIPFFIRNTGLVSPKIRKVFMGDAGSMFIGISLVWLLTLLVEAPAFSGGESSVRPVSVLWLVAVPVMDMAAIMVRRVLRGQSPFLPDRDHLHHIFMRAGFSQREALSVITIFAVVLMIVGILLEISEVPEYLILTLFLLIFCVYCLSLRYSWRLVSWIRAYKGVNGG